MARPLRTVACGGRGPRGRRAPQGRVSSRTGVTEVTASVTRPGGGGPGRTGEAVGARLSPIRLRASTRVRLGRLHPRAIVKEEVDQIIVPLRRAPTSPTGSPRCSASSCRLTPATVPVPIPMRQPSPQPRRWRLASALVAPLASEDREEAPRRAGNPGRALRPDARAVRVQRPVLSLCRHRERLGDLPVPVEKCARRRRERRRLPVLDRIQWHRAHTGPPARTPTTPPSLPTCSRSSFRTRSSARTSRRCGSQSRSSLEAAALAQLEQASTPASGCTGSGASVLAAFPAWYRQVLLRFQEDEDALSAHPGRHLARPRARSSPTWPTTRPR